MDRLRVLIGESSKELGHKICSLLDGTPINAKFLDFPNGEVSIEIKESVRGEDVYVILSVCNSGASPNDNLMKLMVAVDALRRSSAKSITAVIPHFGYARQDRQVIPRTPITSRLMADMLQGVGVDGVITVDIHSTQSAGFFTIPVANLYAAKVLASHIKKMNLEDIIVVSPDAGGASRARYFARRFSSAMALIDKRRDKNNNAEALHVVGDVRGKNCIIFDDMIDTAGTLIEGVRALKAQGAKSVIAAATHGIFSGPAFDRIVLCEELDKIVVTDAIEKENLPKKIEVVSIADLLSKAIKRAHEGGSVSSIS